MITILNYFTNRVSMLPVSQLVVICLSINLVMELVFVVGLPGGEELVKIATSHLFNERWMFQFSTDGIVKML